MANEHTVSQGECFSSIAKEYGFLEQTLWNHPANAELKNKRENPNVLLPGDVVTIPDRQSGEEQASTEQKHVYKARGERIKFNLRVLQNDKPIANENYTLVVDGEQIEGTTDGDGWVRQPIKADAAKGKLVFARIKHEQELLFGYLDPIDEVTGVQGRLRNLGHYPGEVDGAADGLTETALLGFQHKYGLAETGKPDDATKAKLKEIHGS